MDPLSKAFAFFELFGANAKLLFQLWSPRDLDHWGRCSWACQQFHFIFFFINLEPFVPFFPQFLKLPCFFGRSCSRRYRCHVNFLILLSSKERIQWTLNLFSFGYFDKLFFERKYSCDQDRSSWTNTKNRHIASHDAFHFRVGPRLLPAKRTPRIFCSSFLKRSFSEILRLLWHF